MEAAKVYQNQEKQMSPSTQLQGQNDALQYVLKSVVTQTHSTDMKRC